MFIELLEYAGQSFLSFWEFLAIIFSNILYAPVSLFFSDSYYVYVGMLAISHTLLRLCSFCFILFFISTPHTGSSQLTWGELDENRTRKCHKTFISSWESAIFFNKCSLILQVFGSFSGFWEKVDFDHFCCYCFSFFMEKSFQKCFPTIYLFKSMPLLMILST